MRGGLVLGLEDTGSRMTRLGKGELVLRRATCRSTTCSPGSSAVTAEDVAEVAADLLAGRAGSLAVVGPFDEDQRLRRRAVA